MEKKLKEEKENIEDKFPGHSTHQCRRSASSYRIVVSYRFHLLRFCSPVDAIRSSNKIITTTTKWRSVLFFSFTIVTCVLCVRCVSWRRFCRSRPKIWKMLGGGVCRGKWPQRQTRPFSFDGFVATTIFLLISVQCRSDHAQFRCNETIFQFVTWSTDSIAQHRDFFSSFFFKCGYSMCVMAGSNIWNVCLLIERFLFLPLFFLDCIACSWIALETDERDQRWTDKISRQLPTPSAAQNV